MQIKFNSIKSNDYSYKNNNNTSFCSRKTAKNIQKRADYNPLTLKAIGLLSPKKLASIALCEAQYVIDNSNIILMKAKNAKSLSNSILDKSEQIQNIAQSIVYNSSSDYNYSLEVLAKKQKLQQETDKEFSTIANFLQQHADDINKLSSNNDEINFPYNNGIIAILRNKNKYVYEQYDAQGDLSKKATIDTSSKNTPVTIYDYKKSALYEYEMKNNNPYLKSCSLGIKNDIQGKHIKEKYTFENGALKSYQERILQMPNHEYSNIYITYDNDETMFTYDYNLINGDIDTSCTSIFKGSELKLYADNYQIKKDGTKKASQRFEFENDTLAQFDLEPEGEYSNGRYLYNNDELQAYCKIPNAGYNKPIITKSIIFEDNKITNYEETPSKLSLKFKNNTLQSATIGKNKNNTKEKYYFSDGNLNAYQKDIENDLKVGQTMVFADGSLSKYSLDTKTNKDGLTKSNLTLRFSNNKLESIIK